MSRRAIESRRGVVASSVVDTFSPTRPIFRERRDHAEVVLLEAPRAPMHDTGSFAPVMSGRDPTDEHTPFIFDASDACLRGLDEIRLTGRMILSVLKSTVEDVSNEAAHLTRFLTQKSKHSEETLTSQLEGGAVCLRLRCALISCFFLFEVLIVGTCISFSFCAGLCRKGGNSKRSDHHIN
jgi:hypothetical protein